MPRFDLGTHTLRQHPWGPIAQQVLEAALKSVDPRALAAAWARDHLDPRARIWILGAGKAALPMTQGLLDVAAPAVLGGAIVTKHAPPPELRLGPIEVRVGSHPVPDPSSVQAAERLLEVATRVQPGDVVLAPISGGASSLAVAPAPGVSLQDIRQLTRRGLADGSSITELNARRRRLDRFKGGGLARAIDPGARVVALVLSDVVGAGPHTVGSGPLDDPRVHVVSLASNETAVAAAAASARAQGLEVTVRPPLVGIARREGVTLGRQLMEAPPSENVRCTLAGGETRVELTGTGVGGRNQELALAAAPQLLGNPHALLATLATDGEDGPTDAAGAVVDGHTVVRALEQHRDPLEHLRNNDSYPLFDALDDLLRPGPTGTNVCDLTVVLS